MSVVVPFCDENIDFLSEVRPSHGDAISTYALQCLLSVAAQTTRDVEVIVVNDCPTSISCSVVEEIPMANGIDIRCMLTSSGNNGPAAARNTGALAYVVLFVSCGLGRQLSTSPYFILRASSPTHL